MGVFSPKIGWQEPWSWNKVKARAAEIHKEMPPFWRMLVYCIAIPVVGLLTIRHYFPDAPCWVNGWGHMIIIPLGCVFAFMAMPYIYALCPYYIRLYGNRVCFIHGNTAENIDMKRVVSFRFHTIDRRQFFVVCATTRKGQFFERKIEMSGKKVTAQDVIKFLYDVELSHLYKGDDP